MKKILLMGNPNVGKSAFFSRLTDVHLITSNYPGTTVEFTKGYMLMNGKKTEVIDVPGTYTLEPTCKAEEVACDMLKKATKKIVHESNVIINVVDATNLERNLSLTLELMEQKVPIILALNMWDDTKHKGISIDIQKLSRWLKIPVIPTVAVTGEGFAKLISEINNAPVPRVRKHTYLERWEDIGKVIKEIQNIEHRHHSLLDTIQDLTIKPFIGLIFAAFIAFLSFKIIRFIGEGIINYLANPFFENIWKPFLVKLSILFGAQGFIHDIIIGKLINGQIDFVQSFGVLSTALYIEFAMVLPYLIAFYFILGMLEDSGYLPRLAVLVDNIFHHLGLHGFAIVPTLLGFGCNVPGILATRILESTRERFIASTLISIAVPCAALQAMIIGFLGKYGVLPLLIVYGTLFLNWLILGFTLNKLIPGFSPELLLEIPPYRFPPLLIFWKKLLMRIKGFINEAAPIVLIGVLVVNILYHFGIFNLLADFTAPLIKGLLGLPKEAITAIIIGFLRKDVAVGMLIPLSLTIKQLIISSVVLSMFFPCIATFIILLKELGWKYFIRSTFIMLAASLFTGGILNLVLK